MKRPAIHERVAYSARFLASQPMAHFPGHARGGFAVGDAAFKRGVLIGVAPDWTDIAFVRWDDQPEIAITTHIDNLVPEREIARDADRHQHSGGAAA